MAAIFSCGSYDVKIHPHIPAEEPPAYSPMATRDSASWKKIAVGAVLALSVVAIVTTVALLTVVFGVNSNKDSDPNIADRISDCWTNWSSWSKCSSTCGPGNHTRTRSCSDVMECEGSYIEVEPCENNSCDHVNSNNDSDPNIRDPISDSISDPAPPVWTNWSSWSKCSSTCGPGNHTRTRSCSDVMECEGSYIEVEPCEKNSCDHVNSNSDPNIEDPIPDSTSDSASWNKWSPWSKCSSTCGPGNHTRTRTCSDVMECKGSYIEVEPCEKNSCDHVLDIIDGHWGKWEPWSSCPSTCGGGTIFRTRQCDSPAPENGGDNCTGKVNETRQCATGSCPDCDRTCPNGGILQACTYCTCDGFILSGVVKNVNDMPLAHVSVMHVNQQWEALAETDSNGYFEVSDICLLDQTFVFSKATYSDVHVIPDPVNATHSKANVTFLKLIKPQITEQPENKARFIGQNVTICCSAIASPNVDYYEWLLDGNILDDHTSVTGELNLMGLSFADEGSYTCHAVNIAGGTYSTQAYLTVSDFGLSTCSKTPLENWQSLPSTCYLGEAGNTSINAGRCSGSVCVTSSFNDAGICNDGTTTCCVTSKFETVTATCNGFTLDKFIITECTCNTCFASLGITTIAGRAYGMSPTGAEAALRRGSLYHQGVKLAETSLSGEFSFTLLPDISDLVVSFVDVYTDTFMTYSKRLEYMRGEMNYLKVIIPIKPVPISTQSGEDLEIEILNGNEVHVPSRSKRQTDDNGSKMQFTNTQFMYANGTPYMGETNMYLKYFDANNISDIMAAPVVFEAEDDDGETDTLETFAFFTILVEDLLKNPLIITGNFSWSIDMSQYAISNRDDDSPDVDLWSINPNTGRWQYSSALHHSSEEDKTRFKRQTTDYIVGDEEWTGVSELSLTQQKRRSEIYYEPVFNGRNWDTNVKRTRYRRDVVRRSNLCFIRIGVYKNAEFLSPFPSGGMRPTVTIITQDLNGRRNLGYQTATVDGSGNVCVATYCNNKAIIYVTVGEEYLSYADEHNIPSGYPHSNAGDDRFINPRLEVETRDWGTVNGRTGPVYADVNQRVCQNSARQQTEDYHFQFAPFDVESMLSPVIPIDDIRPNKMHWYVFDNQGEAHGCFIKVRVKDSTYTTEIVGISTFIDPVNNDTLKYGYYKTGPRSGPDTALNIKSACIQFKCAGSVVDSSLNTIDDVSTFVQVIFTNRTCTLSKINPDFDDRVDSSVSNNGFNFTANPSDNYGSLYGIYKGTVTRKDVQNDDIKTVKECRSGRDSGEVDDNVNPDLGWALEYECG